MLDSNVHQDQAVYQNNQGNVMKSCIQYIRVSTNKQQLSSLGLEAQEHAIKSFCEREGYKIAYKYQDIDSGGNDEREGLQQAIEKAKCQNSPIIVSKLCRLSREVYFISKLMKHNIPFVVVEMGQEVPPFMLHIVASLNQESRRQIGINTRNSLQQAKRRGVKLGTHNVKVLQAHLDKGQATLERLYPHIQNAKKSGYTSHSRIVVYLNENNILTSRGKEWTRGNIASLLTRINKALSDGRLSNQLTLDL